MITPDTYSSDAKDSDAIQPSRLPEYGRNLNTGAPGQLHAHGAGGKRSLAHAGVPSHLILPTMPS